MQTILFKFIRFLKFSFKIFVLFSGLLLVDFHLKIWGQRRAGLEGGWVDEYKSEFHFPSPFI